MFKLWIKGFFLVCGLYHANAISSSLPDVISAIKPSIVGVATYQATRRPPTSLRGTGFVVGDGRSIITNNHVVNELLNKAKKEHLVILAGTGKNTKIIKAKLVKKDEIHDLALLRIETTLPQMRLASSGFIREGSSIAFTGFPIGAVLGLYPVTHRGIVSSITPSAIPSPSSGQLSVQKIKSLRNPTMVYQLDATAYPGNSGSPVFDDSTGEVVGVINKVLVKATKEDILSKPSGVTYAIPVKHVHELLR